MSPIANSNYARPAADRRSSAFLPVLVSGTLSLLLCAGSVAGQQAPASATSQESPEPAQGPADFVMPEVSLEGLEPEIAKQLANLREAAALALNGDDAAASAGLLADLGRHYHAYDFLDAAAVAYQMTLQLQPEETSAYLLALVQRERGELEDALRLFSLIASRQPNYLAARYYQALTLYDLGRFDSSRATVPEDTTSAAFLVLLGRLAMQEERPDVAATFYTRAIEKAPEANRTHYLLAQAYRAAGDQEKAAEALKLYGPVGAKPSDPLAEGISELRVGSMPLALSGRTAFAAGRYEEAAVLFRDALEARPDDPGLMVNLASALAETGGTEEAISLLTQALALDPSSSSARFNLGLLLVKAGRSQESLPHLAMAVDSAPEDAGLRVEFVKALANTGRLKEALENLLVLRESAELGENLRLLEVQLLVSAGNFGGASERLQAALGAYPTSGQIAHAAARFFASVPSLEHRDGKQALELASLVFEATGKPTDAITVAMAHGELGQCAQAAQWMAMAEEELKGRQGGLTPEQKAFHQAAQQGQDCRPR